MRDVTDFLIIAFITGVIAAFGLVWARRERRTGSSDARSAEALRKAG